jgi:hypothetical protein
MWRRKQQCLKTCTDTNLILIAKISKINKTFTTNMLHQIEEFWKWFIKNESRLWNHTSDNRYDIISEIQEKLAFASDSEEYGIALEFSNITAPKKRLEISADGVVELFDIIIQIVESAPKLDKWEFVAFRQPIPAPFTLNFNDLEFDTSKMVFLPYENEDGELNLVIFGENFKTYNETDLFHYGLITIDNLIGEYNCVTKVKGYDFVDNDEIGDNEVLPLNELPVFIEDYYLEKK